MGFWGDIDGLLAPRTAVRLKTNTAMDGKVAATGGVEETKRQKIRRALSQESGSGRRISQ